MPKEEIEIFAECFIEAWNESLSRQAYFFTRRLDKEDIPMIVDILKEAITKRTEMGKEIA